MTDKTDSVTLPRDLSDGLTLRRATPADVDAVAEINSTILVDPDGPCPDEGEAAWTRDLLSDGHPTVIPDDYTVVEDRDTGQIVSAMVLISQTWSYDGIPIAVGRPEQVVTRPAYRGRGLVRAQIEALHARSAAKGELLQGITGIPYFYRQFGYEMAVTLDGGREVFATGVSALKGEATEPFVFRPATVDDAAWIAGVDAEAVGRYLLSDVRDATMWRYELAGKGEKNWTRPVVSVIETPDGEALGYVAHESRMMSDRLNVMDAEVKPGVSWLRIAPGLLRHLWAAGETMGARDGKRMHSIVFQFGTEHPLYEVAPKALAHEKRPYAWYLRVADLPAFLTTIAPVLAERLARSAVVGYTGALKLSFYRSGLLLKFEGGQLTGVEPWTPTNEDQGSAAFAGLTFLQPLFGYRTVSELREVYPDCWTDNDEAQAVLEALFPRKASNVWYVS